MIWVIIIGIVLFFVFRLVFHSGELIGSATSSGGMHVKYAKLLEHILAGHKDARIFVETRTYIRAGASTEGGTTLWHIQQDLGHRVIIQWESKDNPIFHDMQLEWVFPDNMDQDEMMIKMSLDIQKKINGY